jgi:NADH:ubiquinone oxidoreductase subunit 4 (subunit M)
MDFIAENLLTILILFPVVGAVLTLAYHAFAKNDSQLKWVTLILTLINFVISLGLLSKSVVASDRGSVRSGQTITSASTG